MAYISILDAAVGPPQASSPAASGKGAGPAFAQALAAVGATLPEGAFKLPDPAALFAVLGLDPASAVALENLQALNLSPDVLQALNAALAASGLSTGSPDSSGDPADVARRVLDMLNAAAACLLPGQTLALQPESAVLQVAENASPDAQSSAEAIPGFMEAPSPGPDAPTSPEDVAARLGTLAAEAASNARADSPSAPASQAVPAEAAQTAPQVVSPDAPQLSQDAAPLARPTADRITVEVEKTLTTAPAVVAAGEKSDEALASQSPDSPAAVANSAVLGAAPELQTAAASVVLDPAARRDAGSAPVQPLEALNSAPGQAALVAAEGADPLHQTDGPDQERIIARISAAIRQNAAGERTTIRMRLYPPELGAVRIRIQSIRGAVTARIEASTPAAERILGSNVASLRSDIRSTGVDLRSVEVSHRDSAAQFGLDHREPGRGAYSHDRSPAKNRNKTFQPAEPLPQSLVAATPGALNLFL